MGRIFFPTSPASMTSIFIGFTCPTDGRLQRLETFDRFTQICKASISFGVGHLHLESRQIPTDTVESNPCLPATDVYKSLHDISFLPTIQQANTHFNISSISSHRLFRQYAPKIVLGPSAGSVAWALCKASWNSSSPGMSGNYKRDILVGYM